VTIHLIVGLPGAGKTTRAKELEVSESALRLTPDDWPMAVFHRDTATQWRSPERVEQRDRIEGKLVGSGCGPHGWASTWSSTSASGARTSGRRFGGSRTRWVSARVVYLPIDFEEQRVRIAGRSRTGARGAG
jgi:hypothetical protein